MQGPVVLIGIVLVVALIGLATLVTLVSRKAAGGTARAALMTSGFAVAVLLVVVVGAYTSIYYRKPLGLIALLVLLVAAAIALFVLIGRTVAWRPLRILGLVGIVMVAEVLFAAVALSLDGAGVSPPFPFVTRGVQIAQAKGFQLLLPPGEKMDTYSLPIDPLPKPDEGLYVTYKRFSLEERKDGSGKATGTLEERARQALPPDATQPTFTPVTIDGVQGIAADFSVLPPGGGPKGVANGKTEKAGLVVFVKDGVDVRLLATAGVKEADGKWVPFSGLSAEDLARIAGTMRPAE